LIRDVDVILNSQDGGFHDFITDVIRSGSTMREEYLYIPHRRTVLNYQLILTRNAGDEAY